MMWFGLICRKFSKFEIHLNPCYEKNCIHFINGISGIYR